MALTIWDIVLFLIFVTSLFLLYSMWNVTFYQRRGIRTLPTYPIVGNMVNTIIRREHFMNTLDRAYNLFRDEKYFGFYQFQKPFLVIKDLDIIKQVAIKDFDYFQDHSAFVDEDADPLFAKNLFSLKGKRWREMRATLSPAFTSSKMRNMFIYVAECGELMAKFYHNKTRDTTETLEIEMKEAYARYTNDVIATSAFGIKIDSLNEPTNEFYMMGKMATKFSFVQILKSIGLTSMPKLMKMLNVTLFSTKLTDFFSKLVVQQLRNREANSIIRPDMIHLLMEARKGSLNHDKSIESPDTGFATVEESSLGKQATKHDLTDDDIIAQAIIFFFAGFDTASTLLSFMSIELAINVDVQKKLQGEIDELSIKCEGKPNYNEIQTMKYMDMVVSETLRKWPPGSVTDRLCNKSYKLPPSKGNEKGSMVEPGHGVWIPIYSIHRDPDYFNNPEKFDPERFSDENKSNIKPFTYLPFGLGPRNCIASRFALMEIKSVMFHMLLKFDFVEISKTENPIKLNPKVMNMAPSDGFWIGLRPRC